VAGVSTTVVDGRWPLAAPEPAAPVAAGPRPSLSVAIAAYQAADVVGDAVASALAQSSPPLDVVVCDDGSTDDIEGALRPFEGRVRLLRRAHGGEAAAKNAAAAAAAGEYVVLLDADDVFAPEHLEAIGACLAARPDLDILTTDGWVELGGEPVRRVYHEGFRFPVSGQREAILRSNFVFGLAAVRRSRLLEAGGFDVAIRHATDWDLWLRLILGGSAAGCVTAPLARYRLRPGSLSSQRARMLEGRLQTLANARATQQLSAAERATLDESVGMMRSRLARERALDALLDSRRGARTLSLRAALVPRQHPLTRLKLVAAAAAPRLVGRRLARRPRETTAGLPAVAGAAPTGRGDSRP
jgi:hypothetical protein